MANRFEDMKKNEIHASLNERWILEGSYNKTEIIEIATSKKQEMIEDIRKFFKKWLEDIHAKGVLEREKVDLALVIYVNDSRLRRQDVDNISKVVLDAISKRNKRDNGPYLLENDHNVQRLLIQKFPAVKKGALISDGITISIRKHDPNKDMKLIKKKSLVNL